MNPKLIKVLLVEDDLSDVFWIQELLEAAGRPLYKFELHHCNRLSEALAYLAAGPPDAVLLDLGLPDSQGMQTLSSLIDGRPNLPVVVLTGLADEEFGAATVQKGAQDYLIKGQLNQDQLVRSLRYALERQRAEEALRRSEASLAEAQRIAHLGSWERDIPQDFLSWSDEVYRIFGLAPQELCPTYQTFLSFVHPNDLLRVKHQEEKGLRSGRYGPYDYRIVWRDGSIRFLSARGETYSNQEGQPLRMVGTIMDITERKRAEAEREALLTSIQAQAEELQAGNEELAGQTEELRGLAARLAEVEEAERQNLARELHDQVCQNLAMLSLNLEILKGKAPQEPLDRLVSRLADVATLAEQTGEITRDIMEGLRPTVLDHYGLIGGIRQFGSKFFQQADITLDVRGEERAFRLAAPVELALFRIAQEALSNVVKHSKATQVTVSHEEKADSVRLTIADNGIGFHQDKIAPPSAGKKWGLMTMAERALAIGGRCQVESQPGQGTRVIVEVRR
jgi:two-component system, NarL family, sensor histidine kinase UhpB